MPIPGLIIAGGLAAARLTPFALAVGHKTSKFYGKYGNTSLGQAAQFGLGYGAATNIGYNLSNTYVTSSIQQRSTVLGVRQVNLNMPYGQYRRYSRYPRRQSMYRRRRCWIC